MGKFFVVCSSMILIIVMSARMKLGMKLEPSLLESNETNTINNSSNENNSTSRGMIIIVFNSNREGIGNDSVYNNTLNETEHNETNNNDDNNNPSVEHIEVEFELNEPFVLNRLGDNETKNESIETPPNNNITEAEQPEINPHTTLPMEINSTLNNNETNLHTENTSKTHVKITTVPDINERDDNNNDNEDNNEDDSEIYGFLIKISTKYNNLIDGTGYPLYTFSKDEELIPTCYGPCATRWPPVLLGNPFTLRLRTPLTPSNFILITRRDGLTQLCYNNRPLYYSIKDKRPNSFPKGINSLEGNSLFNTITP